MHIPVLTKEVLEYLDPEPNENFVDCTIGGAGHAIYILERNKPEGKVLGIDQDLEQIKNCKAKLKNFSKRLVLVCDNFKSLEKIVEKEDFKSVSGILFDLGMSSYHPKESKRGFTFLKDEPLDMRYSSQNFLTAQEIINNWEKSEIERILKEYGQERFAKRIAKEIISARKLKIIQTTFQLVEIIKRSTPPWYHHQKIHFATRSFQALRITANDELGSLEKTLPQALKVLEKGGRLVVISFHSLEDKIVKNFFKKKDKEGSLRILTKKPIRPQKKELKMNPASRSAKLRAAKKII
ncbi:16S rRNA (cytosine(1402)-N(4))-methyltransferase RsmH [Patescibacteria group bacterium]